MMKYVAPARLRVEKDVIIRVTRVLKGRGALNVSAGQQVSPEDIIGRSAVSAGFRTLNLAALLSVVPAQVESLLARKLGQRIYKGELLAQKKGWLGKKVVIAPTDGILDFLNEKTGELKIAFLPKQAMLPSGVHGIVEAVDDERGQVIIRTLVSRVYGLFGSGRSRDGILRIVGKKDELMTKGKLQNEDADHILVGGSLFFKDTISAAISIGVTGIVTGGMDAKDYKAVVGGRLVFPKKLENDVGISIVVCEGFGAVPMGADIFEFLSAYEGKFVFIDGNEAVINLPSFSPESLTKIAGTKLPEIKNQNLTTDLERREIISELKVGLTVRIVGNSYLGGQGKILSINESLSLLPSGVSDYLATVETASKKIQVPVANLEIMR